MSTRAAQVDALVSTPLLLYPDPDPVRIETEASRLTRGWDRGLMGVAFLGMLEPFHLSLNGQVLTAMFTRSTMLGRTKDGDPARTLSKRLTRPLAFQSQGALLRLRRSPQGEHFLGPALPPPL